jgi:flagellar biosynthesis/type III secretory pathway M-ring protein FliF/YscJ
MEPIAIGCIIGFLIVAGSFTYACIKARRQTDTLVKSLSHEALNTIVAQLDDPTPVSASA